MVVVGTVHFTIDGETRELGPGAVFGERALLAADGLRTGRVRALTDGAVIAVDRPEVDRLCAEDPGLAERLAELY